MYIMQEHAYELSQRYKEGKYIIELAHMIKDNNWISNQVSDRPFKADVK